MKGTRRPIIGKHTRRTIWSRRHKGERHDNGERDEKERKRLGVAEWDAEGGSEAGKVPGARAWM